MNTEVIKEIANQLGIAVSAVTKDVIPAYALYAIAAHVSRVIIFAVVTIALLVLAQFLIAKSKKYANWEQEKLTKYQRSDMKDKYETFEMIGFVCYGISAFTAVISVVELATMIPWVVSPYGAFVHLLMPH
jgi:hypothetical protein